MYEVRAEYPATGDLRQWRRQHPPADCWHIASVGDGFSLCGHVLERDAEALMLPLDLGDFLVSHVNRMCGPCREQFHKIVA